MPQFYLRHFTRPDGKLVCFQKEGAQFFFSTPNNVAKERDAFSISDEAGRDNSFDAINNDVESFCGPRWSRMSSGDFADDVVQAVWAFSANLLTRSRRFRDEMRTPNQKLAAELRSDRMAKVFERIAMNSTSPFGIGSLHPTDIASQIERASEIAYPISQSLLPEMMEMLKRLGCEFLFSAAEMPFITSDDPIVLSKTGVEYTAKGGFTNLIDVPELEIIIPLLPTVACRWRAGSRLERHNLSQQQSLAQNKAIFRSALMQVYGSDQAIVEASSTP